MSKQGGFPITLFFIKQLLVKLCWFPRALMVSARAEKAPFFFFFPISSYERHGLVQETRAETRPLALTFSNNSWSFLPVLITAFVKEQGRASCHPVCAGAGEGSLSCTALFNFDKK